MGSNGASPQVLSQERVPVGAGLFSIIHTKVSYKLEVGAEGEEANEIQNQRKKSEGPRWGAAPHSNRRGTYQVLQCHNKSQFTQRAVLAGDR